MLMYDANSAPFLEVKLTPAEGHPETLFAAVNQPFVVNPPYWWIEYRRELASADGQVLLRQASVLALEVDGRATPDPAVVNVGAGDSSASFRLRSAGIGNVTVKVALAGLTDVVTIQQTWPWAPLLAALAGGALGGYARRFVKGARRRDTGRRVGEGLIVALLAFVAGVLGTGLLGLPPLLVATEAGAFLTGALAGFLGVTLLEMMTRPARAARA